MRRCTRSLVVLLRLFVYFWQVQNFAYERSRLLNTPLRCGLLCVRGLRLGWYLVVWLFGSSFDCQRRLLLFLFLRQRSFHRRCFETQLCTSSFVAKLTNRYTRSQSFAEVS